MDMEQAVKLLATLIESDRPCQPSVTANRTPLTAVLVTTEHRGVFFGWTYDWSGSTVVLERCRNCIYWTKSVGGFLGLAAHGPNPDCRIGTEVSHFEARCVTSVAKVSASAADKWSNASCVS